VSDLKSLFDSVLDHKIRTIPDKARVIETVQQSGRILAVRGRYDYLEQVLPYCYAADKQLVEPRRPPADLAACDVVLVGCPGKLSVKHWGGALQAFLEAGGSLVTTDWGLDNLIERLFPGILAWQGSAAGTFPLRFRNPDSPLLQGITDCAGTPWVVEAASQCIGILDPKRVDVVLDAPAMGEPAAVLVTFPVGAGLVVHAISHFHLQGSAKAGEYISAYLLTNIIDEAVRRRRPELSQPRVRLVPRPAAGRVRILR
jgi:hypothetical protein